MKKFTIAAVALSAVLASTAGMNAQNFRGGHDNGYDGRSFEQTSRFDRHDLERRQREERLREARKREQMRHHHSFFVTNHGSRYRF